MATSTNRTTDSNPVDGTLSAFVKEAEKARTDPYRLDLGKGKRIAFKNPDEIGTQEYLAVFGGAMDGMSDQAAVKFFFDTMLSEEDRASFLEQNPPLAVTLMVMDAVREHYEAQVPSPGESSASSD